MERNAFVVTVFALSLGLGLGAGLNAQTPASQAPAVPAPRITQDIIVTATLVPVELSSLPRAVTVIRGEEMQRLGLDSVVDALRLVPGVDARARGPRSVQTDFSIRGATFGQNLVLVDGLRINDSQSGHHNGEIPLPSVAVDRLEVVAGPGSAVHGADALGGTINVISRRDRHRVASATAGQHGYLDAQASASLEPMPAGWMATGWASRSSGFAFDRDFVLGGTALRGLVTPAVSFDVRHQRREFGANGFYGPSPSKEWTDQTLAAIGWQTSHGAWTTNVSGLARNHGDHFRWDIARPGFAENRHRTNAAEFALSSGRSMGPDGRITVGASGGGDWVASSNLGDRRYGKGSLFAEWRQRLHSHATLQAGFRFDRFSNFGSAASPTVAVVTTITENLRLRASAGRAFRVPTFTELYYSDPNSLGRADLRAERGWSIDGGLEGAWRGGWSGSLSVFGRWDEDVIDWVRASTADRFLATNIRDVSSTGVEASVTRRWGPSLVRLSYAGLRVDAPDLALFSRYLLEYARHQAGLSLAVPVGAGVRAALNVDRRHRQDGQIYDLVGARLSRGFGRADVFVEATNLLDETYVEVPGVEMPGRWVSVGVRIR
jgi:iron complex outermembrane receptor protein